MPIRRVPWISFEEWSHVKDNVISNSNERMVNAYETLLVWKARCPSMPAKEECTLCLLQPMMQAYDEKNRNNSECVTTTFWTESNLQTSFAMSLVRFINHICPLDSSLGDSLYGIALRQNIPDWIVNLRHDIAHGSSLPPLDILESAVKIAMQWLIENYWTTQNWNKPLTEAVSDEPDFHGVCDLAVKSWLICTTSKENGVAKLSQLDDESWKRICEFGHMLENSTLSSDCAVSGCCETILLESTLRQMEQVSKFKMRSFSKQVIEVIHILAKKKNTRPAILQSFYNSDFLKDSADGSRKKWVAILVKLHSVDSLQSLLEHLFASLKNEIDVPHVVSWLQALITPLENQRKCVSKIENRNGLAEEDDRENSNWLVLKGNKLPELQLDTLRPFLLDPLPELDPHLLSRYLLFVKSLPLQVLSDMKDLLELYQSNEKISGEEPMDCAPYSVDALPTFNQVMANPISSQTWRIASNFDIDTCLSWPIGGLPGRKDPPDLKLPATWKWERSTHSVNI